MGRFNLDLFREIMPLSIDYQHRGSRPTYHPSRVAGGAVEPLPWQGSGDLRTLVDATALAYFPSGNRDFRAGEQVEAFLF
jgi:molybdopterin biosynthesis enzyme